jgi:hypothetical protein
MKKAYTLFNFEEGLNQINTIVDFKDKITGHDISRLISECQLEGFPIYSLIKILKTKQYIKKRPTKNFNLEGWISDLEYDKLFGEEKVQTNKMTGEIDKSGINNNTKLKNKNSTFYYKSFGIVFILILVSIIVLMIYNNEKSDEPKQSISKQEIEKASNPQKKLTNDIVSNDQAKIQIQNTISSWLNCWMNKNIECYMKFLSSDYIYEAGIGKNTQNKNERLANLVAQFAQRKYISISYRNLGINLLGPDKAKVDFYQTYQSDTYNDEGLKTIYLRKENEEWRIYRDISR